MVNLNSERDHGVAVAGGFFRLALYIFVLVLILWVGRSTYSFAHDIFNQQPMSPGNGEEVTVVVKKGASANQIGKVLEKKGLVESARVFAVQENLSTYKGKLKAGTYILSTAYTPDQIMAILSGEKKDGQEGSQ